MIIARYLEQYPEISVYDTYIDNGATGTNFHRPGFQQMLLDIEAGHVNCVIVKDLSRLGRNTIDTGYYIEQYFRIRSIRFIAVNENFDTAAPEDAHSGIIIPLRNMINEAYALDIGRKIKAQQRQAMKDGKFIGARTPYGYLKAEDDCHQLIIDPVAAVVVQRMFRWASEGAGLNTIAVRLNEAGILTPSHYKKMQGKITHENLLGSGKWQTRTVGVILRSEVYTGDLVQGQTKTVDHRQVKADAEEWTVVRDTHEAIISREQFAAVQEILNQTASRAKAREVKAYTPNLLKGKVFCAHCGGSLHRQRNIRKKSDDVYFYHCLSQSRISKGACPGVTNREDALLDMLADMLQDALDTELGQYTLSLAELPRQAADRTELREKITSRKQEIQRLRGIVRSLYENLVQGVLTKDEYFDYKEKYEHRIADLAVEMEQLEDGLRTMDPTKECLQFLYVTVIEVLQSVKDIDTVGFIPGTGKEFLRGYAEVITDAQKFVHRGHCLANRNTAHIAAAFAKVKAHFMFRNVEVMAQLRDALTDKILIFGYLEQADTPFPIYTIICKYCNINRGRAFSIDVSVFE